MPQRRHYLVWIMLLILDGLSSSVVVAGDNAASATAGTIIQPSTTTASSSTVTAKLVPKNKIRAEASTITTTTSHATHPHQGKETPFQPGDPNVALDAKALEVLARGQPFQTQITAPGSSGGRGMVVQDVDAPAHIVWGRILDYDNYAKMVPKTIESENYRILEYGNSNLERSEVAETEQKGDESTSQTEDIQSENTSASQPQPAKTIYTRMKIGFPMLTLQIYVKHLYYPDLNSLTWTLDYSRKSDFDDSCGYWYVVPLSPNQTRVYYAVEISLFDWIPSFVVPFLKNKALTDATAWVKKYSEQEYAKIRAKQKEDEEEQEQLRQHDGHEEQEDEVVSEATDTSDESTSADNEVTKDSPATKSAWRGWFSFTTSPSSAQEPLLEETTTDEELINDDDSCASVTSTALSEQANNEEAKEEDNDSVSASPTEKFSQVAEIKHRPSPVGLTRYALVASVFALSLYNVHLYFSS